MLFSAPYLHDNAERRIMNVARHTQWIIDFSCSARAQVLRCQFEDPV